MCTTVLNAAVLPLSPFKTYSMVYSCIHLYYKTGRNKLYWYCSYFGNTKKNTEETLKTILKSDNFPASDQYY